MGRLEFENFISASLLRKIDGEKILGREKGKNVHAEAKILSYLVFSISENVGKYQNLTMQEIYIGVSKSCCLDCSALIDAANQVFAEREIKITVTTRADSNISFDWAVPFLFKTGYDSHKTGTVAEEQTSNSSLAWAIGSLARKTAQDRRKNNEKNKTTRSMYYDNSESGGSDSENENNIQQTKKGFEETMNSFEATFTSLSLHR